MQEVRWRGVGTSIISGKDSQHKLFWVGYKARNNVVGILLAEKWIDKVIHVTCVNDKLMLLKVLLVKEWLQLYQHMFHNKD